ncbi:MAG TPA: hypothetical protein VFQ00_09385 [Terriglobales bacterium]|nr:hypothetical protein [Terriglobales bacterium]
MSNEKVNSPGMTSKATYGDAEIILRLYELRREPVMREARKFMAFDWWPENFDDFVKISTAGGKEYAYFRQVTSYWDMAMSFVARGALDPNLFMDNAGEMFFLYAKLKVIVQGMRQNNPNFWRRVEEFVLGSPESLAKLRAVETNVERMREKIRSKTAVA